MNRDFAKEVIGEDALYLDNGTDTAIDSLMDSIRNENLLHQISNSAFLRSKMFTWDKAAENLLNQIPTGIVITGGTARLDNIVKSAQKIFDAPLRIGYPKLNQNVNDILDSPACASVFGLCEWAYQQKKYAQHIQSQSKNNWWQSVQKWFVS